ncbi:MAG TPA: M1 family metallopeptidase [Ignavibacteria bacterium]|nr:M1 family metallopeptidase [Ignavibacteria bacterium]
MKKLKIIIPVFVIVSIAVIFWTIAGLAFIYSTVDRDKMFKYYQIISAKYYENFEEDSLNEVNSAVINYQDLYDVKAYSLKLSFDIPDKKIFGIMNMRSLCLSDTLNFIYIDLSDDLKINSIKINGDELSKSSYKRNDNLIVADSRGLIDKDEEFSVEINYEGKPINKGFDSFNIKNFDNEPSIYTLSEPNHAKTWWPCKDVLTDKADVEVIITVPKKLTAVSNGKLENILTDEAGMKTFHWRSAYPTATYLVSLAIGYYDSWNDTYTSVDGNIKMPVEYYTYPYLTEKAKIDWKETPEMLSFFSEKFGEYPFINEKYGMATFGWVGGAMEHQTISSMGYTLVTGNGKYEDVVVHELVHQWYGDAVTPKSWKDIWLNEGFASYGEALWVEHKNGFDAYKNFMRKNDYSFFMGTLYDPEGYIFGPTIYKKGSWVLHMLRGVTGDSLFFEILKTYYEKFKYQNADTYDFQKVCEDITGNDLKYFFNQWIFTGTGRPEYNYSWNFDQINKSQENSKENSETLFKVSINLNQTQEDLEVYSMPIKILFKTNSGDEEIIVFNDKRNQQIDHTLKGKPIDVIIDNDNWVLKKIKKDGNN